MPSLTLKDHDRSISLRLGEELVIHLPENASTGYRWETDRLEPGVLELVALTPDYEGPEVGKAGNVEVRLKAARRGEAEISLRKWRHWEGDASTIDRFRLKVKVAG